VRSSAWKKNLRSLLSSKLVVTVPYECTQVLFATGCVTNTSTHRRRRRRCRYKSHYNSKKTKKKTKTKTKKKKISSNNSNSNRPHAACHPCTINDRYPVFNVNPRLCLGKPLAFLEMKLTTAKILQRFQLTQRREEEHDGSYFVSIVAPPNGQLLVRPSVR
jgi:hypothetical protein